MKSLKKRLEPSSIFLLLALVLGGFVRFNHLSETSFPLNDGGLFYTMTQEIIANGFHLPAFSAYNHLNLPFAYPPLQFFVAGLLSKFLNWNLLDIFRILPAVFSLLTIPAVYLLAKELLKDNFQASLASLIFSLIPASFDWPIMGGGISRAPAFFFAVLSLWSIYRLFTSQEKKYILSTALLSSLTVLSHPETALHTAASALVFLLFLERNKKGVFKSLLVGGLTLLLTSPWWVTVLVNHGFSPFLAAGQTGDYDLKSLFNLLFINQMNEVEFTSIGVLALIGLVVCLAKKQVILPVWFLAIFISEPRSAPLYMTFLVATFASLALVQVMKLLNQLEKIPEAKEPFSELLGGKASKVLLCILLLQWIYSAYSTASLLLNCCTLTPPQLTAFNWIKENTLKESRFLVLTGDAPFTDPVSEWFPTLAERESAGTIQGHEWLPDFSEAFTASINLQACLTKTPQCLETWTAANQQVYQYILVTNAGSSTENGSSRSGLVELLLQSSKHSLVYNVNGIMIFSK